MNDANLEEKLNFGLEVNGYEHYSEFRIKKYQKHVFITVNISESWFYDLK